MALITPIIDRTLNDSIILKQVISRIKSVGFDSASSSDISYFFSSPKGAWNTVDHNRIAYNINFLRDTLNLYGYNVTFDDIQDVVMSDLPYYTTVFTEIDTKLHQLLGAFYTFSHEDFVLSQQLDYHDFNVLESLIQTLYDLILLMVESFNYCGTFYTGDTIML